MKKYLGILLSLQVFVFAGQAQQVVKGKIVSVEEKAPLPGAIIKIDNSSKTVITDLEGDFTVNLSNGKHQLQIRYLGYKSKEVTADVPLKSDLFIILEKDSNQLQEVVINTGYQLLPKERSTGSFTQIDQQLLNLKVSTDVLSRLADVTPGLIFNRDANAKGVKISIHGQSTINANTDPLIVLDNFPFDGNLNDINPNDIESISVLKDAAAASIWGARAGNGVIVINSKRSGYNRAAQVSFYSNLTSIQKIDQFYASKVGSADFVDAEKLLFAQGFYKTSETSTARTALSPVVELLIAKRDGKIDPLLADQQIEAFKSKDLRTDMDRYLNRRGTNLQNGINIKGGGIQDNYYLSAGYDRNLEQLIGNTYDRFTLNANTSHQFLSQKLELSTSIYFSQTKDVNNNNVFPLSNSPFYPYASLVDDQGNPTALNRDYRNEFKQNSTNLGLLDWQYRPLQEIAEADNISKSLAYRLNTSLKYKIIPQLSAQILAQYAVDDVKGRNYQSLETYYTRNLINNYTLVNATTGTFTYNIPLGGILDQLNENQVSQKLRVQLNYSQKFGEQHELNAIGGYEINQSRRITDQFRSYGYDDEHATSKSVDYVTQFDQYYNPVAKAAIPFRNSELDLTDRFISYYSNAAYTYKHRYTLSGSARLDRSNIFGVEANQKGVPLWSVGAAWHISDEPFYKLTWLPDLKLRSTYGYSGNVLKTISAYTTASYSSSAPTTRLPYATIVNPPNPDLRWERVKTINFGADFQSKAARISGSLDYYQKWGLDLIGISSLAPQTGIATFTGNYASIKGSGLDFVLNSRNLNGNLKWMTSFMYSHVTDKVTAYEFKATATTYVQAGGGVPFVGKPLFGAFSYPYAGLDNVGDPQGYLNGVVSKNYSQIIATATPDNILYAGSSRPTDFGSIRNTFSYKGFSVSANVSYRLGYYFRKRSINYNSFLTASSSHGDYYLRWQNPGDENFTQIPALPTARNISRDNLFLYSEYLITKGGHIRLQDINLSYELLQKQIPRLPFKRIQFYLYANNIGLLWKANPYGLDPDYQETPISFSLSGGIKLDL